MVTRARSRAKKPAEISVRNTIRQSISLPANAETLFAMYLDAAAHSEITGHAVTIGPHEGAKFGAFDGQLSGRILAMVRPRLIVQSWRSTNFYAIDPDSTVILLFSDDAATNEGRIDLVHLDVPDQDFKDVMEGWPKHYWTPWREYLTRL